MLMVRGKKGSGRFGIGPAANLNSRASRNLLASRTERRVELGA